MKRSGYPRYSARRHQQRNRFQREGLPCRPQLWDDIFVPRSAAPILTGASSTAWAEAFIAVEVCVIVLRAGPMPTSIHVAQAR